MTKSLVLSLVLLGTAWGSIASAASITAPSADPVTIVQDDDDEEKKKKRGS